MKNPLLLITLVLLTNLVNAQEITYTASSNIQGVETLTNVTELNDGDLNTYKKIRAVNSILNIDTSNDTQLVSYSFVASHHTDFLFDSGMNENATGSESISTGSGLVGNSVIVGGSKNTLSVPLNGLGVNLDEFTFATLIKLASGTTGTVTLLSLKTGAPTEHIVFSYDIGNGELHCNYKGDLKPTKSFTIAADTQYQMTILITDSKLQVFIDQSSVASWSISGGIPADPIETAYLGYDSSNATPGSLIEYDGSYFFDQKIFAGKQDQIHNNTKILNKEPVAGSDFEFGARFWSLYGIKPDLTAILIDEQTNQTFTSGEQKDFNITPSAQYQNYELRVKGFAFSEFELAGTTLSVDKFSEKDFSIKKNNDRVILESNSHFFKYKIYDLTGKLIKEQTQETQSTSIQLVENIAYILKLKIENQVITKKFIM